MSVLDLTHTISGEMPVYPGTEKPVLTTACTIETAGYRETLLHMYSHTGTHMDAPAHMIARGRTLDSYGVEKFVGPGFVLTAAGSRRSRLRFCARTRRISAARSFCSSARAGTGSGEKTVTTKTSPA